MEGVSSARGSEVTVHAALRTGAPPIAHTRARSSQRTSAARHGEKDARGDALSGGMQKTILQANRWNAPASDRRETDRSQAAVGNGGLEWTET